MKKPFHAEEETQHQDRYALLVQAVEKIADYAIFMLDPEGRILTWNLGAERIKGYEEHEIVGKHFSKFYTKKDIKRNHPQEELAIASKLGKFEEEGWRVKKDGSRFWANVLITRLDDQSGEIIGFSKITRDLTERKKAQDALIASESRFRMMVEGVRDYAIFMLDSTGHVATWNQGAQNLKGYRKEEILGKHFSIFYPPEVDRDFIKKELVIATESGKFEQEGWRVKKDGSKFWASVLITPIFNLAKEVVGFSKVTRDLTERKRAEDSLKKLNEDLDRRVLERTNELEKAKKELEQSLKYRDEFMSLASHELKTPITSMMLQVDFARIKFEEAPEKLDPEFGETLNVIELQAQTLVSLIDDLLDVSKVQLGKLQFHFEKINLSEHIKEALKRWEGPLQMENCELTQKLESDIFCVVDKYRFDQVISNLLSNCIKYAPGKPIEVALQKQGKSVILKVKDQGSGIAPELREKVFERFGRGVGPTGISGLGLGLYISKTIIEKHGGKITVEGGPGEGSTFVLTMPMNEKEG